MKLPEYSIKKDISISTGLNSDPIEFPAGTLCFPFWSDHNLPKHIREELNEQVKFKKNGDQYVMCLIGRTWVSVLKQDIRSSN
jgi:hypothetical protein